MKTLALLIAFLIAGGTMASFGMTVFTWQYWVVLISMIVAAVIAHSRGLDNS